MGLLASCAKELSETQAVVENDGIKTTLTIGLPSSTKTSLGTADALGHRSVYWSNGDQVNVNGEVSEALSGVADESTSATFTFSGSLSAPYNVVYPASVFSSLYYLELPSVQTWKSGGFADNMFPMLGYSADGTNITMQHVCSAVKVSVMRAASSPDTDDIVSVRIKGRNGEQLSGIFTYACSSASISPAGGSAGDDVVKVVKTLATSTETAAVYYVVIPSGVYSDGFDVIVQDRSGHIMTKSKTGSFTAEAGHIYAMPAFEFVPTDTELGITISSASELVQFASNYNTKMYESLGSSLVATVTADLTFDATTSAAFNATGGIGMKIAAGDAEDYYFNGVFEGGNHSIKNLEATVPLFTATGDGGEVRNLRLASTSSFTFTHGNAAEADLGSVVGYHKGLLKSVTSYANVTIEAGDITQVTALGGLVGRVTQGTVDACDYDGNITVPSGFSVTGKLTHIGGLVGEITNAAGVIKNSYFYGTLETEARVSSTDKSNPYLFVGGIVGSVAAGTVRNCHVTANTTKVVTMANSNDYEGTIINHTTLAYHMAQGGIAGQNAGTVENCSNGATTQNFVLTTGTDNTAADANSRYYDLGGIVGLNKAGATVSGCTNEGKIESRSTPRIQKIGGVVGYNLGTVTSCSNQSTGEIYLTTTNISPYSLRVGEIGGVIGNNSGTVSDIQNAGYLHYDRTENIAGVEIKIGGVIGLSTTAIDGGSGKDISNTGDILGKYNGTTVTTAGLRFGGVVGSANASVQNVTNAGTVTYQTSSTNVVSSLYMGGIAGEIRGAGSATVSGCENGGEVYFNAANNAKHTDNYAGGIIGKTFESDVTISNCSNSGYIHGGNGSKQNGTTMYVGGIIAYLDGVSSIVDCDNTGKLLNNHFNNTTTKVGSTFEGGIAGFVVGTDTDRITISNVTNNYDSGATITGGRRGYTGGAVGYGEYVDISNATNSNSYNTGSGYFIGGIAGWLVNGTVSGSTMSGTEIASSQMQKGGGIVAVLDSESTVNNCSSSVTSFAHTDTTAGATLVAGAIAGTSVSGSTIKNCHYAASGTVTNSSSGASPSSWAMDICSDTNFTDDGSNAADL